MDDQYVEIDVYILTQTANAVRVKIVNENERKWIPWSVIEDNNENFKDGYKGKMYVQTWWAQKEGLV